MARGVKSSSDSDLPHIEGKLVGDDLRQRSGMALARVQTAGKNRGAAVGFQPDARRFALTTEQLGRAAHQHAVAQVGAAGFHSRRDADAEEPAALPVLGLLSLELLVVDGGKRLAQ